MVPILNKNNDFIGRYSESDYSEAGGRFDIMESLLTLE